MKIHVITREKELSTFYLGNPLQETRCQFQLTIAKNQWFCASVENPNSYSLIGCTVTPGFLFNEFEIANREKLTKEYPHHKKIIEKFTRLI